MPVQHGIKTTEVLTGARPLVTAATAVIGLIATAADAQADAFPLNTPVLISNVRTAIDNAGVDGTLARSLTAIAAHCSPQIVVIRVLAGANAAATTTNILAAIPKFLTAQSQLKVKPRILGIPGFDTQEVTTALVAAARTLRAMVYAKATGANVAAAATYRAEFGARELELLWPDFTGWAGQAVASALGLRALLDQQKGWHTSLSNQAVQGVTGISIPVSWNMTGEGSDAATLNDAPVTTLICNDGYRFWGNRTCADEPKWAFEVAVRTNYVLQDTIDAGLLWAIDKPLTPYLVKDILDTINAKFRELVSTHKLIGATAWYDPDVNSQVDLAAGKLKIDYDFTPCAPLESLGLTSRLTDRYYADFAAQLAQLP